MVFIKKIAKKSFSESFDVSGNAFLLNYQIQSRDYFSSSGSSSAFTKKESDAINDRHQ